MPDPERSRLSGIVFATEELFRCGLVVEKNERGHEILSETAGLNPNYIWSLVDQVPRTQTPATDPKTLLYLVLRHARLAAHAGAGLRILRERGLAELEMYERELVNINSDTPTVFDLLDQPVAALTGSATLAEYLARPQPSARSSAEQRVKEYRDALLGLGRLPTAELERLFTETLDVCAYRLDAWHTSIATKRLRAVRQVQPRGAHIGAYGWVEDLKPLDAGESGEVTIEGEERVSAALYNGGYIYAPSMTHGAAAAVLRNAYMTRVGEDEGPYAINLSSARVREALWLLDTVREGQVLGASLGYLFERELHEKELDRFIDEFRHAYPLVPTLTEASEAAAESIPARNVVDGYTLLRAHTQAGVPHWTLSIDPSQAEESINEAIDRVGNALDALADLLTAESVFQMVGGSAEGTGATLDTMGKGAHPPEPDIASRARGGTGVTHRVALMLGNVLEADSLWPAPNTPRSKTEPRLNAWVGQLLGDPSKVVCEVRFSNGVSVTVTLRDLRVQPLDVLAMTLGDGLLAALDFEFDSHMLESERVHRRSTLDSELDRRVKHAALQLAAGATQPVIHYAAPATGNAHTFPEMLEVARAINESLSSARALQPRDLLVPEESSNVEAQGADPQIAELQARADAALASLAAVVKALDDALPAESPSPTVTDFSAIREALLTASLFGVAAAFPRLSDDELVTGARSVVAELRRRLERAATETDPPRETDPISRVREIFGRDFIFIPMFIPPHQDELAQALTHSPNLGADPDETLSVWFAQAARVRKPLGAWRLLTMYTTARGHDPAARRVVQLPFALDAQWVGLSFKDPPAKRPPSGRVSLMLLGEPPDAGQGWAGLMLDEWLELIPNAAEDAGVVFHYDRPNAEAPQAVLVAVPPDPTQGWSLDLLLNTLKQTLDMAKTRGFDGEWKHATGDRETDHAGDRETEHAGDRETEHAFYANPWLPLILLADADHDSTIATSFQHCLRRGPTG